jgi:hypothetical protein
MAEDWLWGGVLDSFRRLRHIALDEEDEAGKAPGADAGQKESNQQKR